MMPGPSGRPSSAVSTPSTRVSSKPASVNAWRQTAGAASAWSRTVAVGEAPPAVEHSESQVLKIPSANELEGHELTLGSEKRPTVGECVAEIPGRVQHVGRDHQVVGVRIETLRSRVHLDIERLIFDVCSVGCKTRLRGGKESRRDVGEHVVEPPGRQLRQDRLRSRSRARPDLQHPKAPAFRQARDDGPDGIGQHAVGGSGGRRGAIQIRRVRAVAAEEKRQRIGTALEHFGERGAAALQEPELVQTVRVPAAEALREALRLAERFIPERCAGPIDHGEAAALHTLQYTH